MRKTILFRFLALFLLLFSLASCDMLQFGDGTTKNKIKELQISGETSHIFVEGDELTLEDLKGIILNVTYTVDEAQEIDLGDLEELPKGMKIDKLGKVLTAGEVTVTVSYKVGGTTKKATFKLTVEEAPENELSGLEVLAPEVRLEVEEALTLEALKQVKIKASYTLADDVIFDLGKVTELPEGLTIEKLGEKLELGSHSLKVSYVDGEITKEAMLNVLVYEEKVPEGTLILEEIPETTLILEATKALAKAHINVSYGEEAIQVVAFVEDANIIAGNEIYLNDSIELALDKKLRMEGFSDNTLSIVVDAAGNILVKKLKGAEVLADSGVNAEVKMFSFDGKKFAGYKVVLNIPYAITPVSKELHDAAMMVGMTNVTNNELETETIFATDLGQDYNNVHTYALLNEDGTFSQNPYIQLGLVWGNAGSLFKEPTWDINNDDGTENREIHNNASSRDNNIYMHGTDSKEYYAEVKINVRELLNGEKWGKFGLSVTKTDGSEGFFFYVDAASADGINFNNNAVTLGYNTRTGDGWNDSWSNIGSLGGQASQYQGENYITLGIYRFGTMFALYANGNLIKYVSCGIGENDKAYVGITAFNMLLSVKEYFVLKEGLDDYRPHSEEIDYLFLGDSYIDTAFWYNFGDFYGQLSARNIGVGGTKTGYWQDQLLAVSSLYNPKNIIIHIGVNDIDDGNTTGEMTWQRLEVLLNKYHEKFPEAKLHYITISDNMMFMQKHNDYHYLNEHVKEFAEGIEWLEIVDLAKYIVAENGSTMRWYNNADGLHLNVDGYGLLGKLVADSLGLEYDLEGQAGDVLVEGAPMLIHSPGWEVIKEEDETVYHNAGHAFDRIGAEAQLFFKGIYSNSFYAEAKISLEECYASGDEWPKTGLALRTASGTYYFFMNSSTITNGDRIEGFVHYTDNWGNVMYRAEVKDGNWIDKQIGEYVYLGEPGYDHKFDHSYMTLGIARLGKQLAFYANGNMVGYIENANIGENELSAISVFTFNMNTFVKDIAFTEELNDVYAKMPAHNVELPAESASLKVEADKLEAKQGEIVALTITTKEGITVTEVKVNGELVELNQETGKYEFVMPGVNAVVTVKLYGAILVVDNLIKDALILSNPEPEEGEEVVITVKEGLTVKSLLLNGEAMVAEEDGSYKLTLQGYMELTGEIILPADEIEIDLELDELYGNTSDHFLVAGNRDVTVYATKGAYGAYFYVIAHTNNNVTDGDAWHNNHNFEFKINQGATMFVSNQGDGNVKSDNVTTLLRSSALLDSGEFAGKWEHRYEFFVAKENIKDWNLFGELELGYAYKAIGEATSHEGQTGYNWQDNYWQTSISAINARLMAIGQPEAHPGNLFITTNGLRINDPKVAPQNGIIDGNLEEFADKHSLLLGDDKSQFLLSAYVAEDGLYLGVKVYSKLISHDVDNWWENDNVEMQYNGIFFGVLFFDKFVKNSFGNSTIAGLRQELTEGEMFDAGYRYESVFEYFIPGVGEGDLQFSSNGLGFREGAWIPLLWDGNVAHVDANGLGIERELVLPASTAICTVTSNVNGKTYFQDYVEFGLELAEGVNVLSVKMNGEVLEADSETGKYHFIMPNQNVTITIEFDSLLDASAIAAYADIDNMTPELGDKITIQPLETFEMLELYVNGEAVEIKDGKAEVEIEGHTVLTGKFGYEADRIQLDLELDELYGDTFDHFWVANNRDVTVYARKGYLGVYVYVIAHTNSNVINGDAWHNNHNFEFKINQGATMFVSNQGDGNVKSDNVNALVRQSVMLTEGEFAGKFEHRYEFFVAKENITGWTNEGELEFGYAYKAIGEAASHEGQSHHAWIDNYWQTTTSAINERLMTFGAGESHPGNLFITNNGIRVNHPVVAQNGNIDGNLEEFANKHSVLVGDDKAKYLLSAYVAEDGLYIGVKVYSVEISHDVPEWHLNDNVEMFYGDTNFAVCFFDKFIKQTYGNTLVAGSRQEITEGEMFEAGYNYESVFEYFIPGLGAGEMRFSSNGAGFRQGAWIPLFWDANTIHVDEQGLRVLRQIQIPAETSICKVISNKSVAYVGDEVELELQLAEGVNVLSVKMNGEALVADSETGKYSFVMPDQNVSITIEFDSLLDASAISEFADIDNMSPELGDVITVTPKGSLLMFNLFNNGEEVEINENSAQITVTGRVVLTGEFGYEADRIQLDLELDELYGDTFDHFFVANNRDVTVYARKGYFGAYVYVIAHTNNNVIDGKDNDNVVWWQCHNFEFKINQGAQMFVSNMNDENTKSDNIAALVRSSVLLESGEFAGKWEHKYEFFIAKENIAGWTDDGELEFGYAYKAIGEGAHHEGQSYHTWVDNYWQTTTSAINARLMTFGAGESHPGNLFITNNGIRINHPVVAQNGNIDGNLEEFENVHGVLAGDDKAQYDIRAYVAEDGLYIGGTIYSKNISHDVPEWHLNDNVEMVYNGVNIAVCFFDKFIKQSYGNTLVAGSRQEITEGEMYDAGFRYVSVFEYFIPGLGEGEMMISSNGAGFREGAWLPIYWDSQTNPGQAHVDSEGIRALRTIEIPSKTTMLEVTSTKATAYVGEVVELTLTLAENIEALEVKANDEILTLNEGKYSFVMPDRNVKVTVLLSTPQLIVDEGIKQLINISNDDPEVGDEITVSAKDGYTIKSLKANNVDLVPEEGVYKFTFDTYINLDGIVLENVDYLFLGDSYMDVAFWYNFADGFGALDSKNIGVGGTKVEYWEDKLAELGDTYLPRNIIIHIGVNNIDDGETTGLATYGWLETMLNNYHNVFADANIHYITISDNMMFIHKWDEYHALNTNVRALAEANEWLHIVDIANEIKPDEAGSTMRWYCIDGLHFGMDGYALLTRLIKQSLGLSDGLTGALGDLSVEGAPQLVYSPGWELLEGNIYHNAGQGFNRVGAESQIFFKGLYSNEFYAEVKVSLGDPYAEDDWSKTGLALRSSTGTYFYVINASRYINSGRTEEGHVVYDDHFGNMFYRQEVINRNWTSELVNQYFFLNGDFDHYTRNAYLTMGIARRGSDIALFSNGIMVAYYPNALLGEEELTAVSLMTFNMDVYAKDAYFTVDAAEVANKFAKDANIDGNFDDAIYQSAGMNHVLTMGNKTENRHLEFSGVKGSDGIYFKTVIYSFANTQNSSAWYENANVEFRFNGDGEKKYFFYFNGVGFVRAVGSNNGYYAAVGSSEAVPDTNLIRTEVESFIPYSALNVTGLEDNISFKVWGYVFDNDGWFGIMSNGGDQSLAISSLGLRYQRNITLPETTSICEVVGPTNARVGDNISLTLNLASGVTVLNVKVNGNEVAKDEETGKYNFVMPDENVLVTVVFDNLLDASEIAQWADVDNINPVAGDVITITPKGQWIMKSLKNNGEDVEIVNNKAQIAVNAKVVLTGLFRLPADDIETDLVLDEALYGTPTHFWVEDHRDVTVYAAKGALGAYFYVIAHTNDNIIDGKDNDTVVWWQCHNFEFKINQGAQMFVSNMNDENTKSENVTALVRNSVLLDSGEFSGKWEHRYEFFVAKENITNWDDEGLIEFGYAYKAPSEPARFEGQSFNQWPRDNYWQSTTGAINNRFMKMYEGEQHPGNLFIGLNGLVDASPQPTEITLDGVLDEYDDKASITLGNENAKFVITGFSTNTDLYLAFKVYQVQLASPTAEWHLNDNIQINYGANFQNLGLSIFENFIVGTWQTKSAMVRTALTEGEMYDAGYRYETTIEYFVPGVSGAALQFGCNGNGFGGWQPLLWDGNWGYVDPSGVYDNVWTGQEVLKQKENLVTDGIFDEALWTAEVKGLTWTNTVQGSEVSIMGRHLALTNSYVLGITVKHNHPIDEKTQGEGNEWWNYIGPEFRINWDADKQMAVTNWNHSVIGVAPMTFGSQTIDNGEEAPYRYTTTFEIAIMASGYKLGDCPICLGGVWNNGFEWVWGFNWLINVTDNGIVLR